MERILAVSEVAINQVAIEVKVLKIGNRQVTLAVFKQLPEEPVIDTDVGMLNGVPWGRVNYHPSNCEGYSRHMHVIWQKGNELRRAYVSKSLTVTGRVHKSVRRYAEAYLLAYIAEQRELGGDPDFRELTISCEGEKIPVWTEDDDTNWCRVPADVIKVRLGSVYGLPVDKEQIFDEWLAPAVRHRQMIQGGIEQYYAQLEQLEQLFIAV